MFTVNELIQAGQGRLIQAGTAKKVSGIALDSRTIRPGEAFLALKGENFDGHDFISQAVRKGCRCIIRQRKSCAVASGITVIEVADSIRALGAIARFHRRRFSIPVIAVTGSTGKTTTKDMLAWVLSAGFSVLKTEGTKNNHIGLPMALLGLRRSHDMAVVELGTNHFGEIRYLAGIAEAQVGIITNIGQSHLEHFGSERGVLKEKYSLIEQLKPPRIAIVNNDDRLLRAKVLARKPREFTLGFGCLRASDFSASNLALRKERLSFAINGYALTLNTIGAHNIYNALAAIACARVFGISYKKIAERIKVFTFPEGRLTVRTAGGIRFIDDTYNASPASLRQALYALEDYQSSGAKIAVIGDMLELGAHQERFHADAGRHIARFCDTFITVGKLARTAAEAARRSGFDTRKLFSCDSSEEARTLLRRLGVRPQDVILVKGSRLMHMEKIF